MKQPFYMTFWFWGLVFAGFLGIIFWGEDLEKDAQSQYARQKMRLTNVKFDELEAGFENATLYADVVDMDDSQSNMTATNIHAYFFDRKIATRTGELVASWGLKTPFEARIWGDVRLHTSTRERFRGEEMRYFFSRNEMFTSMPVILWKDDMIVTGRELRYNPKTKEGSLARDVVIRIWETASQTASATMKAVASAVARIPPTALSIAPPPALPDTGSIQSLLESITPAYSLLKSCFFRGSKALSERSAPENRRPAGATRNKTPEPLASASLSEIAAPGADTP
ncbi:MAG: hypothetical protein BWY66_00513 [bacterium ADurb.Bin374]|nr:MAG: hypothetical protein BWY66_00513 [bacterium ADurb.Bin374]